MADAHRFCLNHVDRPAVANCVQCHKPICEECVVSAGGKTFCSEGCVGRYEAFYARYKPERPDRLKWLKALLKLAVAAAVALGALYVGRAMGVGFCASVLKHLGL